jgi:RimJ/RimL family protein N-acetyltransferase
MVKFKSFETERLILDPTTEEDAAFIHDLFNTPKFIKFIGDRNIHSVKKAKEYIQTKKLPQLKRLGYSNYTVKLKQDLTRIGTCGLFDREGVEGIDIGFAFLPEYERKGYAYESALRLKEAAFTEFGIAEISAITTKINHSSQRLLEKLGLKLVGLTKVPDDHEELLLFKIKNLNNR